MNVPLKTFISHKHVQQSSRIQNQNIKISSISVHIYQSESNQEKSCYSQQHQRIKIPRNKFNEESEKPTK
jgi:hypothetical protein